MNPTQAQHTVETASHASSNASQQRYAFLVHSADTLTKNLPPQVDNKSLARQRRRRTSPEDQAILEAEYLKNPKPDKAARMAVVQHVALGEKEVQIWFQNRRQSTRRKSRPLMPHEIAQYQQSRALLPLSSKSACTRVTDSIHDEHDMPLVDANGHEEEADHVPQTEDTIQILDESPPRTAFLANRRSTGGLAASDVPMADEGYRHSFCEATAKPRQAIRTTSAMRLSMGSDGSAKIITKDSTSPSPPLTQSMPSSSAPAAITGAADGLEESLFQSSSRSTIEPLRRLGGRAQDSRAWEFWCDKDSRSELAEHAEQEARGSAAGAIGLLRSNSSRRMNSLSGSKRSSLSRELSSSKRTILSTAKTPLLQRSHSLQNQRMSYSSPTGKGLTRSSSPRKLQKAASGLGIHLLSADSDKENWSPDMSSRHRVSRLDDSAHRTVEPRAVRLQPTPRTATPSWQGHAHAQMSSSIVRPSRLDDDVAVDVVDDDDEEVGYFMRRDTKSRSASGEEDLNCVQGLLSLSQGNWK